MIMKIVIVGYGTMGHLLLSRIEEKEDLQCVGLIASSYYREIAELPQHPEVIIDVSHPDNFVKIERAMQTSAFLWFWQRPDTAKRRSRRLKDGQKVYR